MPRSRRFESLFIVGFVVLNLLAPWTIGERYPFTVAPMFSDRPHEYCTYQVIGPGGEELDASRFGLHLVYDGNPPGLGMGIQPPATLHDFGEVASETDVRHHVQTVLNQPENSKLDRVTVIQNHVWREGHGLKRESQTWTITR